MYTHLSSAMKIHHILFVLGQVQHFILKDYSIADLK